MVPGGGRRLPGAGGHPLRRLGGVQGEGGPTRVINRRVHVRAPDGLEVDPCVDALRVLASMLNQMAAHIRGWDRAKERLARSWVQQYGLDGMDMATRAIWAPRLQVNLALRREDRLREWAREATEEAAKRQAKQSRERAKTWREKLRTAVEQGKPRIFTSWVADEQGPPLSVVETKDGTRLVQPKAVAQAFVAEWGELWKPLEEGDMDEVLAQTLRGMAAQGAPAPLTAEQIKEQWIPCRPGGRLGWTIGRSSSSRASPRKHGSVWR